MKGSNAGYRLELGLLVMVFSIIMLGSGMAAASTMTDLPARLGQALGADEYTGGMILSAAILMSAALAMAAAKVDIMPVVIVLFAVMAVLTTLGWLDKWVLMLAAILVAAMFGKLIADKLL